MPCTDDYIQYVLESFSTAGDVTVLKMFGEYAFYLDGKIMGLICDNQVFLKKTQAGTELLGEAAVEGYPYPGAKAAYVFQDLDDRDFINELLRASWEELPYPKPKKKKNNEVKK